MSDCTHLSVEIINPHEFIRKYRCANCHGVMMCLCDKEVGERLLSHQLKKTSDPRTREVIPVTLGFVEGICNPCRGLPEIASPSAPHYGATSKLRRYYWREIHLEAWTRFADWQEEEGLNQSFPHPKNKKFEEIEKEVVKRWSEIHRTNPKYTYAETPPNAVLEEFNIPIESLDGTYIKGAGKDKPLYDVDSGVRYKPEEYVAEQYRKEGWNVEFYESIPFQALFGVLAWLWVNAWSDTSLRMVSFYRDETEVRTFLPKDFGTSAYFERRKDDFYKHTKLFGGSTEGLLSGFDYWVEPSKDLRKYLWAYQEEDIRRAKLLIETLPYETVVKIVTYLAEDYWGRYLGWSDLFLWKGDEFLFIEVKGSKDKLSSTQQSWIRGNAESLHLPFKVVKIHKKSVISMSDTV